MEEDQIQLNIGSAGNTYNPCLIILRDKGWKLRCDSAGESNLWCARKQGVQCWGNCPEELLGIVVLAETFGKDWNRQKPDLMGDVLNAPDGEWI